MKPGWDIDCFHARLGELFRARRKELKLSEEKLSVLAGLDKGRVLAIENGAVEVGAVEAFELCKALRMSPDRISECAVKQSGAV